MFITVKCSVVILLNSVASTKANFGGITEKSSQSIHQGLHGHVICVNLQCWHEWNTAYVFSQSTEEELSISKRKQTVIIKIDPRDQVFCCSTATAVALEGMCCIL